MKELAWKLIGNLFKDNYGIYIVTDLVYYMGNGNEDNSPYLVIYRKYEEGREVGLKLSHFADEFEKEFKPYDLHIKGE